MRNKWNSIVIWGWDFLLGPSSISLEMEETSWSFSLLFLLVHSFFGFFLILFLFLILFKFYVEFLKVLVCIWVCEILNPIVLIRMIGNQFFLLFREANFWFVNLFLEKTFWSFSSYSYGCLDYDLENLFSEMIYQGTVPICDFEMNVVLLLTDWSDFESWLLFSSGKFSNSVSVGIG